MIGKNIKRMREARGLRQSDLADKLNISSKTISSWEVNRTEPNMGMIEKLAEVLHCTKADLIGSDGDDEPQYYMDPETAKVAQEVFDNSDMRILFDAAQDATPDQLRKAAEYIKFLKWGGEKNNDDPA